MKTLIATGITAILLFIIGFLTRDYLFSLCIPDMEYITFSVTSINSQFNMLLLFSFTLAFIPIAAVLLWKFAPVVSSMRKTLSVIIIILGMITSVFIRRELIKFADYSIDSNIKSLIPIQQLQFEFYALVGLIAGCVAAYVLLREKKRPV